MILTKANRVLCILVQAGVAVFALVHWSLDLVWYFFLSSAAFRGTRILGDRFLRGVSLVAGLMLLYFGIRFVADALGGLMG